MITISKPNKPNNMNDIEKIKSELFLEISNLSADFAHEIERIKETLNDLIDYLISGSDESYKREVLKGIRGGLINQPEGYQGLNKWCLTHLGDFVYVNDLFGFANYGCDKQGKWRVGFYIEPNYIERELTESEIKEAILKGCEQNGIVEGARVKCLVDKRHEVLTFSRVQYNVTENCLWASSVDDYNCIVFDNGKFAEVVNNFNCEDGNCIEQCDKCKDSFDVGADKELLKECADLIESTIPNYWVDKQVILDKIKKRLNHE